MKPRSLLSRLFFFISLLLLVAWLLAAFMSWKETREYINEFYDTEQMLFAKKLAASNLNSITFQLPSTDDLLEYTQDKQRGEQEEEALSFAIFDQKGNLLLSDGEEESENFVFNQHSQGFVDIYLPYSDNEWRIVWLDSLDRTFRVAVGQELEYRWDMTWDLMEEQLFPWLFALPLILLGILWLVYRELKPLRTVAKGLTKRTPLDSTPLSSEGLPSEVIPLVSALNSLFLRSSTMLARERAFISDAAHELKTPLAALRVQAEIAAFENADPKMQKKALAQLIKGIDRSSRLIGQLLSLSRLEAVNQHENQSALKGELSPLNWAKLLEEVEQEFLPVAEKKKIVLGISIVAKPVSVLGQPALIMLMLRNLFENALKYTPRSGGIEIILNKKQLSIRNTGTGCPEEFLQRLGERFFRPPGQSELGSGLGLSIVQRVADLHNLQATYQNVKTLNDAKIEGFIVTILMP